MATYLVPTEAGEFEVETEAEDPTEEELLALVNGETEPEGPSLARRGAAFGVRVGGPIIGGIAGGLVAGPPGAVVGAGVTGAASEALAQRILNEEFDLTEIGLSGVLSAVPAGPFAKAAAKPGLTIARRALLTAGEGATQGALAAQAESLVKEGELAGVAETARAAAGGAVLGGTIGAVAARAGRGRAKAVASGDPPIPAGHVRLFRGEVDPAAPGFQPDYPHGGASGWYTTDRGLTEMYVQHAQAKLGGGRTVYVDVTPDELRELQVSSTEAGAAANVFQPGPSITSRARALPSATAIAPQTDAAEAAQATQGNLFRQVPGLAGDVPPRSPIPDSRLQELIDDVDVKFPHLGEVERLALKTNITEMGDELLHQSRSVQSVERTDALAQELVFDLSRPLRRGTALNAEQMRHVVNLVSPLQERVTALAGEVVARPNDDVLKLKLQHASTRLTNVLLSYAGARAEAGRTLNILKAQAKALMVGDAKAILAARKLGIDADEIAKVIAASPNDPVSQYKQLRDMYRPDWKDKLKWYYYTNILSGPQTHARNLVSNTVSLALRPLATPFAAAADVAASAMTGREREVFMGETPIKYLQMYRSLPESWNKAMFMFRNGFSLSDVADFEVRPPEMPGGIAVNLVGRALAATDEFFRGIGFNMELHAGAFARARRQAMKEGLKGAELRDRTSALTAELLDRKPSDLLEQADKASRRVTFQEEDNAVARGLMAFRDAIPGGTFLLPFVRTPANIFRQGLQFSPAGFLMKGKGREGQQQVGEAVLGSALLMPVAWLAATGQITGAAPTDAGERDAFYAEGKKPNSILIPGIGWTSYAEAGPLVLPFAVVANAADAWRRSGGEMSQETVGQIIGQVGRSTLEQSYLTSLSAVFQAIEDPQRYGAAFVQNLASGFLPLVGLQRNIERSIDPYVRQPTTFAEGLQKNVPVLAEELLPKLDALGQPVTHATGAGAFLVPQVSPERFDPIREELEAAGVQIEPLRRAKDIQVGEEKFKLSPDDDFAIRRANGAFRTILLRDLFADPDYQEATQEEKQAAIQQAIKQAGSSANEGARSLLAEGQPVTFEALTEGIDEPEVAEQRQTATSPIADTPVPKGGPLAAGGPKTALDSIFESVGNTVGVDPTFLKAAAKVESNFNAGARGPATKYGTAVGVMQILPSTFRLYEAQAREILGREPSIESPEDNILVGGLMYRDLLDQTSDDPVQAASLYHGGSDPRNHGSKTRDYAAKVAGTYDRFTRGEQ